MSRRTVLPVTFAGCNAPGATADLPSAFDALAAATVVATMPTTPPPVPRTGEADAAPGLGECAVPTHRSVASLTTPHRPLEIPERCRTLRVQYGSSNCVL